MPPFDSTIAFRRDPYRFIRDTCDGLGRDHFRSRLLLEPALFLTGPEAARFFYDGGRFRRKGAAPGFVKATLFGRGGVQGLDDAAHRHRKAQFLSVVGPGRTGALIRASEAAVAAMIAEGGKITLQDRLEVVLTATVLGWAGLPVPEGRELRQEARMLSDLFEHAGSVGAGHLKARLSRRRADRRARGWIEAVRRGRAAAPPDSALARVAAWTGTDGRPLPAEVAAVELLNILRPFVAIATYLTFALHALASRPDIAVRLASAPDEVPLFVQEVRRSYPFFPAVAARARHDLDWQGTRLANGGLAVLDLWGTCHDPAIWDRPEAFDPDRFRDWPGDPFTMIPQGGNGHETGHRCPGEWITRDVMEVGVRQFLRHDFAVPKQDLSLEMTAMPGLPRSRMVVAFRPAR